VNRYYEVPAAVEKTEGAKGKTGALCRLRPLALMGSREANNVPAAASNDR